MRCQCRGNSPQHPGHHSARPTCKSTFDTCIGWSTRPVLASDNHLSEHPAAGVASLCVHYNELSLAVTTRNPSSWFLAANPSNWRAESSDSIGRHVLPSSDAQDLDRCCSDRDSEPPRAPNLSWCQTPMPTTPPRARFIGMLGRVVGDRRKPDFAIAWANGAWPPTGVAGEPVSPTRPRNSPVVCIIFSLPVLPDMRPVQTILQEADLAAAESVLCVGGTVPCGRWFMDSHTTGRVLVPPCMRVSCWR